MCVVNRCLLLRMFCKLAPCGAITWFVEIRENALGVYTVDIVFDTKVCPSSDFFPYLLRIDLENWVNPLLLIPYAHQLDRSIPMVLRNLVAGTRLLSC